jgi:CRP/FNR family transcriptional regulator, nitrogen oxide reductase regulator
MKPAITPAAIVAQRLAGLPGIAELPEPCRAALAERGRLATFRPEEPILREGQASESLFVVLRGRVKMSRATPVGRTVILALFGPGEVFGAVAALASRVANASITAIEETQCLEVQRATVFDLFRQHPQLLERILPFLTRQLVECKNCMVELTGFRVEIRFAHLLLKLGDRIGVRRDDGIFLPIQLSRQELADMTGTTIETCIRLMSRWKSEGLVETRTDGFLLRDHAALELVSRGLGAGAGDFGPTRC